VEIVYERVAAIDVGKKVIAVVVRVPGERAGKRHQQVRKFNTYYRTVAPQARHAIIDKSKPESHKAAVIPTSVGEATVKRACE
jgi:hypothetical protein